MVYSFVFFWAICTYKARHLWYIVELRLPNFMLFLHYNNLCRVDYKWGSLICNLLISILLSKVKDRKHWCYFLANKKYQTLALLVPALRWSIFFGRLIGPHGCRRAVTKISICQVNTTNRREIKQLGISFASILYYSRSPMTRTPC